MKKLKKRQIANVYRSLTQQGECGEQGTATLACKGAGIVEEKVSALQLPKPPAPNSSSADGVDNLPRDPVRYTSSVMGHAPGDCNKNREMREGAFGSMAVNAGGPGGRRHTRE